MLTQFTRRSKLREREVKRFCAMEIKIHYNSKHPDESQHPLLKDKDETEEKTLIQKAISQTFQSTAHLASLLPTGSVLSFQLLSPIFTNQGSCDSISKFMTSALVTLCGVSCFLLSFTDSFKNKKGEICYGFATIKGLWVIDGSATLSPELAANYRLRFIDFMHAFMSILVFIAVALFDTNVVSCVFPMPSYEIQEILTRLPVGIGVICSMFFVVFPTKRHGIGYPLSAN
ncbi:protein DMP4-like [Castanea sativa]|uniref:protein DMP4-like n=1 Tax=Castanea sativa TaxID=21020 RepID=UPI003F64CA4E